MPIFEANGKKYNVKDEYLDAFAKDYPDAVTYEDREGKRYRVKSKDYNSFISQFDKPSEPAVVAPIEDNSEFEENQRLFSEGKPTKGVTTQSIIDAHPELGLQPKQYSEEVLQRSSENVPDYFKSKKDVPLVDRPLGTDAPIGSDERLAARVDIAKKNLEDTEYQKDSTKNQLRRLSDRVSENLNELGGRVDTGIDRFMPANMQYMPTNPVNQELMPEYTALRKAQRLVDESQNIIDEASKKGNTNFMAGLARGFWDNLNAEDYTFGADDAAQSAYLYQALNKAEKGEKLTKAEETLLDAAVINMATQAYYAQDLGRGYGAGSVTAESIPFMLEMAINPISSAGKASAKALLKYGLKKFGSKAVNKAVKAGTRLATDALSSVGMAATTGAGDVLEGATDRMAKNYNYGFDENGKLKVDKKDDTMGFEEALGRSFATRAIENQSEMIFRAFDGAGALLKGVDKYIPGGVNTFFDAVKNSKVGQLWRGIKNSPIRKEFMEATKVGGIAEEYLEEVYNNFANVALGEMTMDEALNLDNNIDTFLGLAPTQAMFAMLGLGGMAATRYQTRRDIEDLRAVMNERQREALDGLLKMGSTAEIKDVRAFIRNTMSDQTLTIAEKRNAIEAAYDVAKQKAVNDIAEAEIEDKVTEENADIDSKTDTSTGIYAEAVALVSDGEGGVVEQPGNIVGYIGGQPIFVPEGMENTEENRIILKPGYLVEGSMVQAPSEEVKASNEEMIRDEAEAQAELESRYAPEVLNAQMQQGQPIDTPSEQIIPISPMPEGNGWIVEVYAKDTNNKVAAKPEVREITTDEFRDILQAQLDAEEATIKAEQAVVEEQQQVAPQAEEIVAEQPTIATEEAAQPVVEEAKPQAPVIPTKQDGSIDFVAYGKEGSIKELGNQYGEKMPHKVAVTAKAFADDVVKAKENLDKANEALDNAPIGREQKAKEAQIKAQQAYEAVKNEADFWAEMDADIKAAQAEREAMLNPQVEVDMSEQPMTADEFVAQQLANGNITLTSESYKKETGFGEKERKKFPKMFRKAENGGMTIERAGERLMEIASEEGLSFFDQDDANAGRDALINFLGSVYSWGDVAGYVRNSREAMAKRESEASRDEMEAFIWNNFHMTPEEYATQREIEGAENPFTDVNVEELDAIFALTIEEYQEYERNQSNEQGAEASIAERSDNVLSEEQADNTGRTEQGEGIGQAEGNGSRIADTNETAQAAELTQNEGESVLDFAARVAEEQRRKPLRARAREWSKALGVDVVMLESAEEITDERTRREVEAAHVKGGAVPGWVTDDGKVYFLMSDISNIKDVDETYIHEVVAHIGLKNLLGKERFAELCDKVWEMMPKSAQDYYMSYPGVKNHRDAADEYIAHLAEKQNLTPEEKTIWDNIVKAFRELLDKAINGIIGKSKLTDKDIADLIRASYANLKSGAESKDIVYQNEQTGQTLFSIRTYRESGRDKLIDFVGKRVQDNALTEEQGAEIVSEMDNIYETVQKYTGVYQPFGTWSEADVAVDESGKPVFSVIKANGEYGMNLDFSLVCKKRRTLDAVFDEMIRRGVISDYELGQVDIAKINAVIREFGFETACRLCFVDAKRFRVAKVADDFCAMYNELASMSDAKLKKIVKNTKKATVRKKTAQHLLEHPEDKVMLSRDNFMSAKGFEGIKINKDAVMRLYNSAKGTGGPKASYGDVQYLNDIAAKQWTPEQAYPVGGVRLQSFSDYVPRMVFDYVQMVADLAAKNLPVHAYTKEPIFAKQFGLSGIKINLSLVPRVDADGVAPGLDKDGNYAWQDGETFPYDEAIAIQNAEGYRENCGTIAVGVSDEHIEKMLGDDNIRMVIPYHKSGLNPDVAKFNNIDKFADYTNEQNTRNSDGKKLNKTQLADMPNFNQQMHDGMTAREAAQAYLDWCYANGYLPKFDKFRNHPNYYKLLEDFTTIVPVEGAENVYPQQGVQMRFPSESDAFGSMDNLIREGLEEDAILEGRRQENIGDVVDAIEDALGEGTRFSVKEKASFSDRSDAVSDNSSSKGLLNGGSAHLSRSTLAPQEDVAKLLKNNEVTISSAKKVINEGGLRGLTKVETAIRTLGAKLKLQKSSSSMSYYGDFYEGDFIVDGLALHLRLSTHPANGMRMGNADADDKVSIVIRKDGEHFSSGEHNGYVEYVYEPEEVSLDDAANAILKGVVNLITEGEFIDETGKAIKNPYPYVDEKGETRFRVANQNQEIFVSNAQKAVEGIKQEKATPQQWLAMIEKNGGLKAGEDKWLGLSDWLKASDKKSITKAEILDFIGENKIVIEEVKYEEGDNVGFDEFGGSSYLDGIEREFDNLRVEYGVADAERKLMENHPGIEEFAYVENGYLEWDYDEAEIAEWINKDARVKSKVNPINSTRLEYTTKGLENKAEIALTVPTIESWNESDEIHFGDAGEGRAVAWIRFGETVAPKAEYEKEAREADKALTEYQNELADKYMEDGGSGDPTEYLDMMTEDEIKHMRELSGRMFDAREAADNNVDRILVIDEIQSKRHQEGRDKGYKEDFKKQLDAIESEWLIADKAIMDKARDIAESLGMRKMDVYKDITSAAIYKGKQKEFNDNRIEEIYGKKLAKEFLPLSENKRKLTKDADDIKIKLYDSIPSAPFEKNWSELAFKRMLRYAAENGFDKVAWTTGLQQAERYNLGKVVDSISIAKSKREEGKYHVTSWDKYTMPIGIASGNKSAEELKELFGKAVADELIKGVENLDEGSDTFVLEGAALEVGGEGMKGFYDKMLSSFVNKYVKKWGTKVQDIELPNVEEAGRIMHSVDVTEAMKESVMEGQTMFRVKDVQPAIDSFTSKYNSKPVVVIDNTMTDEDKVDAFDDLMTLDQINSEISDGTKAGYVRDNGKIYIFADNAIEDELEEGLFHENLHAYIADYGSLVDKLWDASDDISGKRKDRVKKHYKEDKWKEEFFVVTIADAQSKGDFTKVFEVLSESEQQNLIEALKKFGYDYEQESKERSQSRELGRIRSEVGRQGGRIRTAGSRISGKVGRGSEKETRAAEIRRLFDQVADNGLRGVVGDKAYNTEMFEMYRSLPMEARERVAMNALNNHGADMGKAMDKFIGESYDTSLWDVVVGAIRNMLRKKGYDIRFSENDIRYLVWRNRQKLNRDSILDVAEDIDTRYRLKVGEYEGSPTDGGDTPDGGGTRFRTKKPEKIDIADNRSTIIKRYDEALKTGKFNFQEAFQDRMLSLKVLMDEIVAATGKKVRSFEDAYEAENQLSSNNKVDQERYIKKFYTPLVGYLKQISKKHGEEIVRRYIYCKSGLERNEVLRQRDADEAFNAAKEELDEKLAKNQLTQAQYDALLQQAEDERLKTLSEDVDYSGIRGMLFNVRAQELFEQYQSGALSESNYKQKIEDLKNDKANVVKDWKDFAEQSVADLESRATSSELDELWSRINAATNETLRIDFESGMIDRETYEAEKKMMKYYVPLRDWENTKAEEMYEYRHDMTPTITTNQQRAKGRESEAANPMATIALMAQNAIVRGNRNKMKMKLYSFVVNRPTDLASVRNVWYVRIPGTKTWEARYADTSAAQSEAEIKQIMEQFEADMELLEEQGEARRGKLKQGMGYRASRKQKDEHIVVVMINGKEYGVYINGNPRAAQAVNGLTNAENVDDGYAWIDNLKRLYGGSLTSWDPNFVVPNFVRDTIHASTMTFLDRGVLGAVQYMANIPKIFAQVSAEVSGLSTGNAKLHQYFEEFVNNGGETGYTEVHTLEDYKKEYQKLMDEAKGLKAGIKKGFKLPFQKMAKVLEAANRIAEDVNRFNAYVTSREAGENIVNSIDAAKNITVNFNRKGALHANSTVYGKVASFMNRWILFFNPSVQGLYQLVSKSKMNPKRATALGATIIASGFFMPLLNEMLVAAFGGDDEDDYWNQSDFKRRNNWMLFTGNGYVSIPLPPVLREIYGMGDIIYGVMTGHIPPQRAIYDVLNQVQSAIGFVTLLPEVSQEPDVQTWLKGFAPDLASPFLDVMSNTNFMGRPIAKWTDYNETEPEYERVYKGVGKHWVALSKVLNELRGNETRRSDWWGNTINPAMMEHLVTSYTGGIGKTINNLVGMVIDAVEGDTENMDVFRKAPIIPRFYTPNDEKTVVPAINRKFYEFNYQYNNAKKSLKKSQDGVKSGEHPEWQKYIDEMKRNGEYDFIKYFEKANKKLKKKQDLLKKNPDDKKLEQEVIDMKADISAESFKILSGQK